MPRAGQARIRSSSSGVTAADFGQARVGNCDLSPSHSHRPKLVTYVAASFSPGLAISGRVPLAVGGAKVAIDTLEELSEQQVNEAVADIDQVRAMVDVLSGGWGRGALKFVN